MRVKIFRAKHHMELQDAINEFIGSEAEIYEFTIQYQDTDIGCSALIIYQRKDSHERR